MNVLQRRALAESIGVSVEELSKLASGKLDIKSDNVDPIDAQTEATKMLTKTTDDLRTTLLKIITPLAVLSDVIRALAGKLGIEIPKIAKPGTPAPKVPKPTPPSKVVKTPGGRFKPEGMKGPGFIKEADACLLYTSPSPRDS